MKVLLQFLTVAYVALTGCATAHSLGNKPAVVEDNGSPLPSVSLTAEELKEIEDEADVVVKGNVSTSTTGVYGNALKIRGLDAPDVQSVKEQVNTVLQRVNDNAEEGDRVPLWEEDDRPLTGDQVDTLRKLKELGLIEGPEVDAVLELNDSSTDEEEEIEVPAVEEQKRQVGVYIGGGIRLDTKIIHGDGSQIRLNQSK
ncbi:MAG: hypothetical protein OYG31_02940 [Candidatus Kaiserbacteria bacterium]|nr:hypothetical protein [Candidatus Kaiserbacteria bacterium]